MCNFFLWTGKVSYSIYLIHYAAINIVFRGIDLQGIETDILVKIFACIFGWLLLKIEEKPGAKIGNRLIKKLQNKKKASVAPN